jgi:hypothetical protein
LADAYCQFQIARLSLDDKLGLFEVELGPNAASNGEGLRFGVYSTVILVRRFRDGAPVKVNLNVDKTAVKFNTPKRKRSIARQRRHGTVKLFIPGFVLRLRGQDTTETVDYITIIAVDDIPVGRLHLESIARRPGTATQHTPITTASARSAFVSIKAPFPNVSAEIVQA